MTWAKRTLGLWIALVATTSMAGTRFKDARIDILGLAPIDAVAMRLPIDESPDFPHRSPADRVDVDFVPVADEVPFGNSAPYLEKFYDFSTGFLKPKATLHIMFWLWRADGRTPVRDPIRLRDAFVARLQHDGFHFEAPIPDNVGSSGPIALRAAIGGSVTHYYLYPLSPQVYGELAFHYIGPRGVGWERKANAVEDQIVASVRFDRTTSP